MNEQEIAQIEEKINLGYTNESIKILNDFLSKSTDKETIYILLGKTYQKQGKWAEALNNFQYAIDINPCSRALEFRKMIIDIMNFYNKDMFNQ